MMDFLPYFFYAFLGGIILNIMPCVLPVLTLKIFHILHTQSASQRFPKIHAIAYSAGTISTFCIFSLFIISIKKTGQFIGWGMQFQNPVFIASLSILIFIFALNALGVFEIFISINPKKLDTHISTSFIHGVFMAIMSTPCTAPFLSLATTFALGSDATPLQTLFIFMNMGIGLAFPFTLICFFPSFSKIIPPPGNWMITFKHIMGFSLLATVIWLLGSLQTQINTSSFNNFLFFILIIAILFWGIGRFAHLEHSFIRRYSIYLSALFIAILSAKPLLEFELRKDNHTLSTNSHKISWTNFDTERISQEHKCQRPIFMEYTADWCVACKTNEKLFLETKTVRKALKNTGILPMKVDMTKSDPQKEKWLSNLKRSGIPAYAIYLPDGKKDILPIVITANLIAEHLNKASQKFPPPHLCQ